MRHQPHSHVQRVPIDAGRQVAQLRHVLRLVQELSGQPSGGDAGDADLDEGARIVGFYEEADPVVQRRFDILAAETASWSAAAVEALLVAGGGRSPAAARRLAEELERSVVDLSAMLRPAFPEASAAALHPSDGLGPQAIPSP